MYTNIIEIYIDETPDWIFMVQSSINKNTAFRLIHENNNMFFYTVSNRIIGMIEDPSIGMDIDITGNKYDYANSWWVYYTYGNLVNSMMDFMLEFVEKLK
jgi:hypothetical protein